MKKLMNQPEHFVKETMEGIIAAYGDKVRLLNGDYRILLSNYETRPGKVGIVTAGGSGHLPVFLGYVGQGLLDGCTVGNAVSYTHLDVYKRQACISGEMTASRTP